MNLRPLTVAVVGATGVVGRTMIQILNEREFPVGELRLLASGRSAGRTVSIEGRTLEIAEAVPDAFEGVDIALFSAGADISTELAPAAVAHGATVIDNSSAWRMDPPIPLVVSQVNPDDLEGHPGIIANPNCSTMQLAPVLMALRDTVGPRAGRRRHLPVRVGDGRRRAGRARGPDPRPRDRRGPGRDRLPAPDRVQRPARDRRLPANGYTKEEWKVVTENRKILHLPGPADLVHGRAHPGLRQPLRGGPRRDARADHAGARARAVRGGPGRRRPGRPLQHATRWRPRPPGATRSSSGGSGATSRSPTIAASPSGSSRTTCARAPRPTRSSLPRSSRERDWIKPAAARGAKPFAAPPRGHGVTDVERRTALEEIAAEVRVCTNCRLHQTRTKAVPGEGDPDTEVVFVGEGPGFNEDREGRPFIGRAGDLLVKMLARSAGAARTCSSPTSSSAGRRTIATRSPTRSPPARRTCSASSRSSIRPSS